MKVRSGFVSNSSSSSFVVHKSELSDEKWKQLIFLLESIVENEEDEDGWLSPWNDDGTTWEISGNYIEVGWHNFPSAYRDQIKSIISTDKDSFYEKVYLTEG